ncbi:CAP domain-containing protein [uncultured Subdoligranulum sp.]|uniref:CAP domain-containing protein n=1 Tax=uncultured Subdoligranulum sp. TaxID=512298 RepID=UPI0025DA93C2|nr:CAP domain-containing protein [uncultured Subdoligranulum sp.]
MKKALVLMLSLIMLTGCATTRTEPTATATPESAITATPDTAASEETTTPESSAVETAVPELEKETEMAGSPTPSPVPTESPEAEQIAVINQETSSEAAAATTVEMSYGVLPFDLAAGTQEWWGIDSSDAAYWAVQDNINAMREAGGLPDLSMDSSLSAAADARCESFVAGGPFDHSGMTTTSEICASGPLESASAVCTAWQNSPTHYANIMNASFTSMGVGCWFCDTDQGRYTYWVVTFS